MHKELELLTQKIKILTNSISDHNPIRWQFKTNKVIQKRWIINEDILDIEDNVKTIKKEINEYFKINDIQETETAVVWDAFKAVMRGQLIKLNKIAKKKQEEKDKQLEQELEETEQKLKRRPGNKKTRKEIKTIETTKKIIWRINK